MTFPDLTTPAQRTRAITGAILILTTTIVLVFWQLIPGIDSGIRADQAIHDWVVDHRTSALTSVVQALTHLADWKTAVALGVIVSALLLRRHQYASTAFYWLSILGGFVLLKTLKKLYDRDRPDIADRLEFITSAAFPSGHAITALACYGSIAILSALYLRGAQRRVLVTLCLAIIAFVGFSRVYLGVHWTTDVIGGWIIAAEWMCITYLVTIAFRRPAGEPEKESTLQ